MRDEPIRAELALVGELGLSGELRMVGQIDARIREAANLGFKQIIIPRGMQRKQPWPGGIEVLEARSLRDALSLAMVK